MKPWYSYRKTVIMLIVTVLAGYLFFPGCTKTSPFKNSDQTSPAGSVDGADSRHHRNQPPRAKAGADQVITNTSTVLDGTASYDDDGSIVTYQWTKETGPAATIQSPGAARTNVTGLINRGSYRFRLIVTDNDGAAGADTVHVTLNGAEPNNQPPVANAGPDRTITLPTNSVTLTGTASDPDGNIVSYQWAKMSGNGANITTPSLATTIVSGLTAGSYIFSFKVTDNGGATATDYVNVTVNGTTVTSGSAPGYTSTYSNGYNSLSDINSKQLGRGTISTTRFLTGPGSFRSEVRAGDPPISSGWRSEQQYVGDQYTPAESAVEYDVYYENWGGFDGGGHSIQWHPMTSGGGALVSLQNYNGKFDVVRDPDGNVYHQTGTLKDCLSNTWYHMRWEFRWTTASNGYVRLYINNELYYSYTGRTTDGSGVYLKVGQNRWPFSGNTMQTTSVCYYDNLKIYQKN
jgi:hypothetical protein